MKIELSEGSDVPLIETMPLLNNSEDETIEPERREDVERAQGLDDALGAALDGNAVTEAGVSGTKMSGVEALSR